ncbi:MAG: cyclodeaminase/cyclohydrolase family protein [Phycisphaerales bacterium]|jgi:methenyltetrahydrofolate cyclohydrolase|nr:cyclodeaminase/cyclohydrolase family protein [Phycisphaerales bacterium]MBT7171995.1 cyclodeaminase/cyclohydrolase family protein [Phycisphaerales bacterium]
MSNLLDQSVVSFCKATAAKQSTPGGGSVAGVAGALATALGEMSLSYSRGKKSFSAQNALQEELAERLSALREQFLKLVTEDIEAFGAYQTATEMPEGPDRDEAQSSALAASIEIPRTMARLTLSLLSNLESLATCCTKWLLSDLLAAASLASATCDLCDFNVRINATQLPDDDAKTKLLTVSAADRKTARSLFESIEESIDL